MGSAGNRQCQGGPASEPGDQECPAPHQGPDQRSVNRASPPATARPEDRNRLTDNIYCRRPAPTPTTDPPAPTPPQPNQDNSTTGRQPPKPCPAYTWTPDLQAPGSRSGLLQRTGTQSRLDKCNGSEPTEQVVDLSARFDPCRAIEQHYSTIQNRHPQKKCPN